MGCGAQEERREGGKAVSRKTQIPAAPGLSFPSYSNGWADLEGWGLG